MSQQINAIIIPYEALSENSALNNRFETLFIQAVEEAFSAFGETAKQAIYGVLEKNHNIKKSEIPGKIDVFTCAVEAVFGESALLVELKILENLGRIKDFKFKSRKGMFLFAEYVEALKNHFSPLTC
jgi:hypothetical protein